MADYHVNFDKENDQWKVTKSGGERSSGNFGRQSDAVERANDLARGSGGGEVNIHRKDNNQIRDKNTIGKKDPHPPRG